MSEERSGGKRERECDGETDSQFVNDEEQAEKDNRFLLVKLE
jgi:hypothetical protein